MAIGYARDVVDVLHQAWSALGLPELNDRALLKLRKALWKGDGVRSVSTIGYGARDGEMTVGRMEFLLEKAPHDITVYGDDPTTQAVSSWVRTAIFQTAALKDFMAEELHSPPVIDLINFHLVVHHTFGIPSIGAQLGIYAASLGMMTGQVVDPGDVYYGHVDSNGYVWIQTPHAMLDFGLTKLLKQYKKEAIKAKRPVPKRLVLGLPFGRSPAPDLDEFMGQPQQEVIERWLGQNVCDPLEAEGMQVKWVWHVTNLLHRSTGTFYPETTSPLSALPMGPGALTGLSGMRAAFNSFAAHGREVGEGFVRALRNG